MQSKDGKKQRDPLITDHIIAIEKLTEMAKVRILFSASISLCAPFLLSTDSGQLCASDDFGVEY